MSQFDCVHCQRRSTRHVTARRPDASTAAVLRRQRKRWHRGLWETLWAYRGMLLRPRYGKVGFVALPWFWVFELFAPLLEMFGIIIVPLIGKDFFEFNGEFQTGQAVTPGQAAVCYEGDVVIAGGWICRHAVVAAVA